MLLKAAVRGEWVLLDNANLCSPTVLDRLNPLLEIGGSLLVSECGMRDGKPRVVTAHPAFRLFLALDPRRGEVSRAMRNRGVEVFLMPPETSSPTKALRASPEKNTDASTSSTAAEGALALPAPMVMPPERHTIECDLAAVLSAAGVPRGSRPRRHDRRAPRARRSTGSCISGERRRRRPGGGGAGGTHRERGCAMGLTRGRAPGSRRRRRRRPLRRVGSRLLEGRGFRRRAPRRRGRVPIRRRAVPRRPSRSFGRAL